LDKLWDTISKFVGGLGQLGAILLLCSLGIFIAVAFQLRFLHWISEVTLFDKFHALR
jgi:hypothetical protein